MKKLTKKNLTLLLLILFGYSGISQVSGIITDSDNNPLIGVSINEKGTTNGTISDIDGSFSLTPQNYPTVLVFTYVGYSRQEVSVDGKTMGMNVMMSEGVGLDEVVVTGTRGKPRTILNSPVPIDNFNASELIKSGQTQIDQMLNYKVPSFNSQNQAISDATAHYDPADLRGLGPSRTLVLVNGKRKNQSAQVYLNRTPGKGEVGVDLKSIPTAAIERVEVLRDGASAQYGSDAIAGVINMILKKDVEYSTFNARTGITSEGDGFNFGADFNSTKKIGDGFINYTLGYFKQNETNRAGNVGAGDQGAAPNSADYAGGESDPDYIRDLGFWQRNEDWLAANPDASMKVGQPNINKLDVFANMEYPISDNSTFYTFHGVTQRDGRSYAYYRAPYWRRDVAEAEHFTTFENHIGYHPTFDVDILDNINSAGIKSELFGFNTDLSLTYGRNAVNYTVTNSVNRDYLADHGWSPSTFNPGGYNFSNTIANLDFNRTFGADDNIFIGFGYESKKENFQSIAGDKFSFYKGGSDSFAGIKPEEEVDEDRTSNAGYLTLDYDITDDLLLGAAARFEDFSDFGSNFAWKVNGRYKLGNKGAIRGSVSTGFRAPTLHQRYLINSQYIIVQGSPDPQLQGTLANNNPAVQALGVPNLFAETSLNFTGGVTYRLNDHISASVDYYNITIKDRVLFSSQIQAQTPGDAIDVILQQNGVKAVQFFINAGDTKTNGVDFVLNFDNYRIGSDGRFGATLAANFNSTTIDAINTPATLENAGYNIFDRREQSLITDSRPKSKIILGLNYSTDKWSVGLDNTQFGEVTVTSPSGEQFDQVHSAKLVTDLRLGYTFSDALQFTFNANNIFDVYPDVLNADTGESANGRFVYSSIVQQQNFLGTNYSIGLNLTFAELND